MKQSKSQKVKKPTIQVVKQRPSREDAQIDNQWSFLEDEEDLVTYQHAYEFAPEHRFFN